MIRFFKWYSRSNNPVVTGLVGLAVVVAAILAILGYLYGLAAFLNFLNPSAAAETIMAYTYVTTLALPIGAAVCWIAGKSTQAVLRTKFNG